MLLDKIPSNCETKVLIECDFKASQKCKGRYTKVYKNAVKCQANNNGKDCCIYCFNTLTKQGTDNYNFKYEKDESFFDNIDSELKAYLLGWVAGDGHIKKDGLYLSVHKKDIEISNLFRDSIAPNCKQFFRDYDNTVNIRINSVKIVHSLCKALRVSVGKKSHKISLPDISDDLMIHFIRGLIDSDGSVSTLTAKSKNRSPNCNYCSMSEIIKNQIVEFCKIKGITCSKTGHSVVWWGACAISFLSMIYDNSSYKLTRKYDLYIDWSSWVPYHGTAKYPAKKIDKSRINMTGLPWYKKRMLENKAVE
jgi:hypothetical protein